MSLLNKVGQPRKWLTSLLASALAASALVALPLTASAHNITGGTAGIDIDCDENPQVVSIFVDHWDVSTAVEITRTSPLPAADFGKVSKKNPVASTDKVTFVIADIGGNGDYTVGREGHPNDPKPIPFTINCAPPHQPSGTLLGDIQLCDSAGTHVDGGTIGATGTSAGSTPTVPPQNNSLSATVNAGIYTEQATAPAHYHFVNCKEFQGGGSDATIKNIHVPDGGSGNAIFYVAATTGTLTGDIKLCTGTHVDGGTIAATGPTNVPAQNNSMSATVKPGTYAEQATAPANYQFVSCNGFSGSGAGATISGINVPDNGTGSATFYVQLIPTTPAGGVQGAGTGAGNGSGASPSQGVLGAAVTQPNTGLNDWAKSMMLALAMVVLGTALLLRQAFSESASDR
jgi:phage baseplate assembly protein gpV